MMYSESLDYVFEERDRYLWVILSGPFSNEQIPTFREKIVTLINDGNRRIVVDLEMVSSIESGITAVFLQLLNIIAGKGGMLKLVFKNDHVSKAFSRYRNIFSIYPDADLLRQGGLLGLIKRQRRIMLRRTGIRISRPVALLFLVIIIGWFLTLFFVIYLQHRHINEQEVELHDLSEWETKSRIEIDRLRSRLRPLEQLGILKDTAEAP